MGGRVLGAVADGRRRDLGILLAVLGVVSMSAALVRAETTVPVPATGPAVEDTAAGKTPLATKEQIVRDRMSQLEDRMFRLREKLGKSEPKQAERLEKALRQARELLIRHSMDETMNLLDRGDLTEAADRQMAIMKSLEQVLKTLLEDSENAEQRKKDMDELKAFRDEVKALLESQRQLKQQNPKAGPATRPFDAAEAAGQQRTLEQKADHLADRMGASTQPAGLSAQIQPNGDGKGQDKPGNKPSGQDGQKGPQQGEKQSGDKQPGEPKSGDPGEKQQGGEPPPKPPTPGAKNVRQAGRHMDDAAGDLDKKKPDDANQNQQKATDQLEQALDELEQTLDQLRREQQEEILRGLEARFRAMLAQQLAINEHTKSLDGKGKPAWTHGDELALAGLVQDERGLAGQADEALRILKEEGTTIVFPRIVEQLRDDMQQVATGLSESLTAPTQVTQAGIVKALEELIEAVKQLREELQGEGGGGGGGGGKAPLLPTSAELKLLRSCQQRVNQQTLDLSQAQTDVERSTPQGKGELKRISERQRQLAEMARKMNERVTGQ